MKRTDLSINHLEQILNESEKYLEASCQTMDTIKAKTRFLLLISIALFTSTIGYISTMTPDSTIFMKIAVISVLTLTFVPMVLLVWSSRSYFKEMSGISTTVSFDPTEYQDGVIDDSFEPFLTEMRYKYYLIFTALRYNKRRNNNVIVNNDKIRTVKWATWILASNLAVAFALATVKLFGVGWNLF
jgi:hypothetical protein